MIQQTTQHIGRLCSRRNVGSTSMATVTLDSEVAPLSGDSADCGWPSEGPRPSQPCISTMASCRNSSLTTQERNCPGPLAPQVIHPSIKSTHANDPEAANSPSGRGICCTLEMICGVLTRHGVLAGDCVAGEFPPGALSDWCVASWAARASARRFSALCLSSARACTDVAQAKPLGATFSMTSAQFDKQNEQ